MYTSEAQVRFLVFAMLFYGIPGRIDCFMGIYVIDPTFSAFEFLLSVFHKILCKEIIILRTPLSMFLQRTLLSPHE